MQRIFVIGAGAWGTALAQLCARNKKDVILWSRNTKVVGAINSGHENTLYLPGVPLEKTIHATEKWDALEDTDLWVVAVPAQTMRGCLTAMKNALHRAALLPILLCAKGIEEKTGKLMHEVAESVFPDAPITVLSGPNFADEVAKGLPAATTIATPLAVLGEKLAETLGGACFRPYVTEDRIGVEIGGAVKNVIAIACGIAEGKGLGHNAKAALITRGIAEIGKICMAKGGSYTTVMGLSGMGDVVLTCTSAKSRNMSLGIALGQGRSLQAIMAERISVAEGIASAASVMALAASLGVEVPICEAVYRIVYEQQNIDDVIATLLQRPFASELPDRFMYGK